MLKHIITCIFIFYIKISYSQVSIDFENNSLLLWEESATGHWEISSANSISENYSLHHAFDDTVTGKDQIAMPIGNLDLTQSIIWKFKIKHGYNPSSSNNWSVFLFADVSAQLMTPSSNCNAFVLGVNFLGSDDFLKIWKKSGETNEEQFNTYFNWQDNVEINDYVELEVRFSPPETWIIEISVNNDADRTYQSDFSLKPHLNLAQYFGIYYEYSSSQDQKLWFDDLEIIGNFLVDKIPPSISSVTVQQDYIDITFSEAIKSKTIKENSIAISPDTDFTVVSQSSTQLSLELETPLEIDKEYVLNLKGIKDLSNNVMKDTTLTVQFSIARQNDIVITEIMADPIPKVELPDQEFIEIYNRSLKSFNLTNYSIWVGDKQQIIHSGNILPGEYIIICDDSDTEVFADFGKVIEVKSLPNLTKSSGAITLCNNLEQTIHQLRYTDDVFVSDTKQQGGWTLEMIDTDNPCNFENNWGESQDISGGTPGRKNSIENKNQDVDPPTIKNITLISDKSIQISFNELIDSLYTSQNITCNLDKVEKFRIIDFENVEAFLTESILTRKLYEISLTGARDCATNEIDNTIFYPFAKTEEPDSLDIVFNEIMFDPEPNSPEYIELVNVSDKFLDLNNLYLLKQKSTSEFDTISISKTSTLFLPEQLAVLSKSNELVYYNYTINQNTKYLEMENFPSLTNTSGVYALQTSTGRIIDVFEYTESMHFELLQETKGVALEKISVENSSLDRNNWQSASASVNYATPGWPNSQILNYNSTPYTPFTIEPEVFSPNYDGYNDELHINYNI